MSTKLTGYVWDGCAASGMKLSSVAIMARLADFSNDEGVCWPSIETIARQIGAGMSTVRTAIARLEAEGWLTRKARRQGMVKNPELTAKKEQESEMSSNGAEIVANSLVLMPSADYARQICGAGSQLARMVEAYRQTDPFGELYVIAVPESTGAAATVTLTVPAPKGKRFTMTEQQTLLSHGVATAYVESGVLRIQRDVTTYRKNAYGVADNSYLDSETLHTSAYVLRKLKSVITSKYGRHKLASDGTRFGPGQAIVTPAVIKGELLATYRQLERAGIVENYELFKQYLVVERDASDPNRLNTLFPPDYVNQLRVFAVVNQFRLQYSEESA